MCVCVLICFKYILITQVYAKQNLTRISKYDPLMIMNAVQTGAYYFNIFTYLLSYIHTYYVKGRLKSSER